MVAKYELVKDRMIEGIRKGKYKPGTKAPSIREMSEAFNCNKATVIRAYEELQKEHILYSVPKSGFYIVEKTLIPKSDDVTKIDFASASPAISLMPFEVYKHCVNQAIDKYKNDLFSYSDIQGLPGLRKTIAHHLTHYQIFTSESNIYLASGAQQALYLLSQMPFPNGKRNVLIEQPTYYGMLKAPETLQITTLGITRESSGLNLDELERIFRTGDIKFFYTIPRFHNPTGYSYNQEYKKRILLLAERYDVYIIEDDYLGDLELDLKAEPMYAMGFQQRVLYVKSYSKTLLPGLRLCILVLPKTLSAAYHKAKACCDLITNTLAQGALGIYINSGMYETHIKKIKHYYHQQMNTLKDASAELQPLLPAFKVSDIPDTGFFTQITLPDTVKASDLENGLRARNVHVVSSVKMYLPSYMNHHQLRLSICQTDSAQIHQGVGIIAETTRDHIKNTPPSARRSIESFF